MNFDKKNQKEKLGNNSTYSLKVITKKKFPLQSKVGIKTWNESKQTFTEEWQDMFFNEGVVFEPVYLKDETFELHDEKGKIGIYKFPKNTFFYYCDEFKGDSIEVESELVKPNN